MHKVIVGSEFAASLIPVINSAKKSLEFIVFDWRWYPEDPGAACQQFNYAIVCAARRGVNIRAIVNNDEIAKAFNRNGCNFKKCKSRKLLHCKLIIVDGQIGVIGSHNYTQSAMQMNLELSLMLDDDETIKRFSSFFENIWQQNLG
jgi:phosphatidylserine/phosphatidylglycerophosphate/cardiolipin synthase-like enzyme